MSRRPSKPRADWNRRLTEPLRTRDGTVLATLADARSYMLALSTARAMRVTWQKAAELILEAAAGGDIEAASQQLELALLMDGDIDFGPPPPRRSWPRR
jgi:hypothetical protein